MKNVINASCSPSLKFREENHPSTSRMHETSEVVDLHGDHAREAISNEHDDNFEVIEVDVTDDNVSGQENVNADKTKKKRKRKNMGFRRGTITKKMNTEKESAHKRSRIIQKRYYEKTMEEIQLNIFWRLPIFA